MLHRTLTPPQKTEKETKNLDANIMFFVCLLSHLYPIANLKVLKCRISPLFITSLPSSSLLSFPFAHCSSLLLFTPRSWAHSHLWWPLLYCVISSLRKLFPRIPLVSSHISPYGESPPGLVDIKLHSTSFSPWQVNVLYLLLRSIEHKMIVILKKKKWP